MSGIFNTINTANKGLMAQQTALHTTGHNISNANTEGFSRQRVDLKADLAYNYSGVGQLGTGVKMESVVRMVNDYVGKQIRGENGKLQEFASKAEVIEQLEVIFNEPSDTSLNFNIGEMFDAWQELSKNPEMETSKTIVVEKSKTLADTFNHMLGQIDDLGKETTAMIKSNMEAFNSTVDKLETLNKQIFNVAIKGHKPNDLLDQRDLLLKDLSSLSDFDAKFDDYGRVSIGIGGDEILKAGQAAKELVYNEDEKTLTLGGEVLDIKTGSIKGNLEALKVLDESKKDLKLFGKTMAEAVNAVHGHIAKRDEDGNIVEGNTDEFFIYNDGNLKVNDALDKDSSLINAGKEATSAEGDGSRALAISRLRNTRINFDKDTSFGDAVINEDLSLKDQAGGNTIGGYYNKIVTNIGISKEHADNMVANQDILLGQLELRRESVSGVSLDEEITNIIKFQSAYGANARMISTLSEMLDTLINRMGV